MQRIAAALLHSATATPTVAICGIGGVGKTTLAAEFAHRYGAYFAGGVWWLNCAEPALIAQEIATCGARLVDWRPDYRDLTLDDQVQLTLAVWQQPVPRLLIFDNCEDEEIVRRFRPPTGGCRVIITTRRAGWSAALGVDAQRLDVLHPEDAHALLLRYRPDLARDAAMVATLDAIAAELGGLPLALHLAGSYLETYRDDPDLGDPATFLDEVRAMDVLSHDAMRGIDTSATPTDHERHVANTFLVSYRCLTPDASPADAHAVALLARAARLAPGEAIPRDLLLATLQLPEEDRSARREAARGLNRLLDLGLLERLEADTLRIHRLLSAFARQAAPDDGAQAAVEEAVIAAAVAANESSVPAQMAPLLPHLRLLAEAARTRDDERAASLLGNYGFYLSMVGDYAAARQHYERALAIREQTLGPAHPDTAASLNNLAEALRAQGEYAAAQPLYERALAIREQALEPAHPLTAMSLNNLAVLLAYQQRFDQAIPLIERALAIREQVLGAERPDTVQTRKSLADMRAAAQKSESSDAAVQDAVG